MAGTESLAALNKVVYLACSHAATLNAAVTINYPSTYAPPSGATDWFA